MKSQIDIFDEIIVDNFAGGGGASTGIELAAGRPVAIAINHDPDAILLHKTNHPYTEHLQASVWDVDPVEVVHGDWTIIEDDWNDDTVYQCSVCKEEFVTIDGTPAENLWNYCPNCGAKMDGGNEDGNS